MIAHVFKREDRAESAVVKGVIVIREVRDHEFFEGFDIALRVAVNRVAVRKSVDRVEHDGEIRLGIVSRDHVDISLQKFGKFFRRFEIGKDELFHGGDHRFVRFAVRS